MADGQQQPGGERTSTDVNPKVVVAALRRDPAIRLRVLVHHETTTRLLAPLRELCRVAVDDGETTVVNAISSVGAHRLDLSSRAVTSGSVISTI
ncbi:MULTISPECIES: hypothetical protein [Frankia]|uniref:hypothetical protein n=1 Tax=Frankia TaxID=1854 RepID=UPI0004DCB62A|nr:MULTISPECIES: hypothetical protein [Frankia]KEZ34527.1 hypothetical protein CEDDRAFT_04109 [Frankia sp. CeD]